VLADIYKILKIYLIVAVIALTAITVYEAYINNNWALLSFIPFIFLLGLLDAEYLAIDEEYHGY
jgi:hypothetical protein